MILDYLEDGFGYFGQDGGQSTCDMWGTVLANSDNTKEGNIRVRVRTMNNKMDTFDNVPVLTEYGGKNYGVFCLPEEGDTVRLTFTGGDFRHPIVTGCRFPESSQFVEDLCKKEKAQKAFRAKNGSGVSFTGEKGKEQIEVYGAQNMAWLLDEEKQQISFGDKEKKNYVLLDKKNRKTQVVSQDSIRLECGKSSLELKKDGTIVLKCEKLTLEAANVDIQGKAKVRIKGQEILLDGATGITVKGNGQIKLDSKGPLKLSGAMIHLN